MRPHPALSPVTLALLAAAAPAQSFSPTQAPFSASPEALQEAFSKIEARTHPAELRAGSGDDPLDGPMFSRVWQRGQPATAESVRLGAALLLSGSAKATAVVIPILESAVNSGAATADAISASLAEAYYQDKRYDQSLAVSKVLLNKLPQSGAALRLVLQAACASGGRNEAGRIVDTQFGRFKDDMPALRSAASLEMSCGDPERSIAISKKIVDSGQAVANDYNGIAWATLFAGTVTEATLETGNRGMLVANNRDAALMHTLAAVEAELGQTGGSARHSAAANRGAR